VHLHFITGVQSSIFFPLHEERERERRERGGRENILPCARRETERERQRERDREREEVSLRSERVRK